VREALEWLDDNADAEKEEYEERLKEVQDVCGPIVARVYQESGGAGGAGGVDDEDLGAHDEL
jgi:heat shock protein 5